MGADCVNRFVGMWAFALLDVSKRSVLLSRDRFGIKPLFYTRVGGAVHFASEIKALLKVPGLNVEPNQRILQRFIVTGAIDTTEETFFDGIRRLPPAHNLTLELDRKGAEPQPVRYWSYPAQDGQVSGAEAAEGFGYLLEDSLRVHARSDVPVGTCLSGGLDSSSIVCLAEELRAAGEVPRYTHSAFGYLPLDPEALGAASHAVGDRPDRARMFFIDTPLERFTEKVLEIVRQQDEPFGSTSIAAQWFVFEAARREGMKVMLDGQGADEVLGGYQSDFSVIASDLLRNGGCSATGAFAASTRSCSATGRSPSGTASGRCCRSR